MKGNFRNQLHCDDCGGDCDNGDYSDYLHDDNTHKIQHLENDINLMMTPIL
jgi:hypothetical protein